MLRREFLTGMAALAGSSLKAAPAPHRIDVHHHLFPPAYRSAIGNLAAAHAGCFTMALSNQLAQAGLKADSLETSCTITLEQKDGGFAITESHLELKAKVPGASQEAFDKATQGAKSGCPVSKLYNTNITLDAKLES